MKTLLLVTLFLVCGTVCLAQDPAAEPLSRTVFKLSPQHFTINALKAGVERFNKNHTGSVSIFVTGMMAKDKDDYYSNSYDGLAGELQLRKYVSPMKARTSKSNRTFHEGVYGAVYLQGGSYSGSFDYETVNYDPITGVPSYQYYNYDENIGNWGGGFTIGYQKTLWQVVFMEAFIGGGLQFSDQILMGPRPDYVDSGADGISDPLYRGIIPKIGLNIGVGL